MVKKLGIFNGENRKGLNANKKALLAQGFF